MKVFEFNNRKRITAEKRKEIMREFGEKKFSPYNVFFLFENPTTMPKLRLFIVSETNPNRIKFLDNGQVVECGEGEVIYGEGTMEYMNKGLLEKMGVVNDLEKDTRDVERNGYFFNDMIYAEKYGLIKNLYNGKNKEEPLNKISIMEIVEASLYKQQANENNLEILADFRKANSPEIYMSYIIKRGYDCVLNEAKAYGISQEEIHLIEKMAEEKLKRKAKSLSPSEYEKQVEDFKAKELAKICAEARAERKDPDQWKENPSFQKIDWEQDQMPSEDKKDGPFNIDSLVTKDAIKNNYHHFWRVADYLKYQNKVNEVLQEYWPAPISYNEQELKSADESRDLRF